MRKDPKAYRTNEPLSNFKISALTWDRVHSDTIGPHPVTRNGNIFVLVFADSFSKNIIAELISDQNAITTGTIMNRFVARFRPPQLRDTAKGFNYLSDTFQEMLKSIHVLHKTSTPYHHESTGLVQRSNRTIKELIGMATMQRKDQWSDVIFLAVQT